MIKCEGGSVTLDGSPINLAAELTCAAISLRSRAEKVAPGLGDLLIKGMIDNLTDPKSFNTDPEEEPEPEAEEEPSYAVGDRVEFIDADSHEDYPDFYPPVGTVGEVTAVLCGGKMINVHWPKGTTAGDMDKTCQIFRVAPAE